MGLFDSLPPPSANKAEATAALGKRPADDDPPATDDSASKRSRSGSAQELGSSGSGGLPEQRSGSGCTALQAAYSEDAGSRLAMEGVSRGALVPAT